MNFHENIIDSISLSRLQFIRNEPHYYCWHFTLKMHFWFPPIQRMLRYQWTASVV
jgi:hypothetical protein